jgi:hypothetical protein
MNMASNQSYKKSWDVNPLLTPFLQEFRQQAFIAGRILPDVPGGDAEWLRVPSFSKDRVIVHSAYRAIGAPSNTVQMGKNSYVDLIMDEFDMQVALDYRLVQNTTFNAQLRAALVAMEGIELWKEKLVADMVMNTANYPATNFNNAIPVKWDDQPATNAGLALGAPTSVGALVKAGAQVIRGATGCYPNAMVIGAQVWDKALSINPELLALVRNVVPRMPVEDDLKYLFRWLKEINVGVGTYFVPTGLDSDGLFTGSFVDLYGSDVLIYYNPLLDGASPLQQAPAFGYTYVKNGFPIADDYDPATGGKTRNFRATKIQKPVILGNTFAYLFKGVLL